MPVNDFYRLPEQQLYSDIEFKIATDEQLDEWIAEGLYIHWMTFPDQSGRRLRQQLTNTVMIIAVIYTAGAAMSTLAAGSAGSIVATSAATGATAGATAASAVAATTTMTTLQTIQAVAQVIAASTNIAGVMGKDVPESLSKAANLLSGDLKAQFIDKGIEAGVEYLLAKHGTTIDKKNTRAMDALHERIDRERKEQAVLLKQLADEQAAMRNLPLPSEQPENIKQPTRMLDILALATPFILYYMSGS